MFAEDLEEKREIRRRERVRNARCDIWCFGLSFIHLGKIFVWLGFIGFLRKLEYVDRIHWLLEEAMNSTLKRT